MYFLNWIAFMSPLLLSAVSNGQSPRSRDKRYLLTPTNTESGVNFVVSFPLEVGSQTSFSWFFAGNYYTVANASYWHSMLGDSVVIRNREKRSDEKHFHPIFTRYLAYSSLETLLLKHGFPGQECLLRAICEAAKVHTLHNGLVGDLLYVLLTPSSSAEEDEIEDVYYQAEITGNLNDCSAYYHDCPLDLLELIT